MSTSTSTSTTAPARDDVRPAGPVPTPRQARRERRAEVHAARAGALPPVGTRTVRRVGAAVALGAVGFATAFLTVGPNPATSVGVTVSDLLQLPFQLSLFGLVTLQLRTRATGLGRGAVAMLRVEYVLLGLATLWTVLHALVPAFRDDLWLAVLDVFWPLSMLGMAVIGVKVALAGRWRGRLRVWPALAESWAVATVPVFVVTGGSVVASYVGAGHMLLGYGLLGLWLVLRPGLTGARED